MSSRVQELFDANIKRVVSAYEKEVDIKIIAQKIGVSPPTITKWLVQEGYKRKKKGRIPIAMKSRVQELDRRGWDHPRIASLLNLSLSQIEEFSKPLKNPILGGEKDPLKVKDKKLKKKEKTKSRKGTKETRSKKKDEKWPPERHKCNKHWKPIEKSYVLELIEKRVKPLTIYKKTRASRSRQIKIWREGGGEGLPPNFGPPKATKSTSPSAAREISKRREEMAIVHKDADEKLKKLEELASHRHQRIAELEAQIIEEERKIKQLEYEQKRLVLERREKSERLSQARAAIEQRRPAAVERARVLPGSYESEVLGLEPGTIIEPGKPGRPALPKPAHLGEYADNGKYFVVSKDWADLSDASKDELKFFAYHLTAKGFPSKVETKGDQPKAYFESSWPKSVENKWLSAVESGLSILDRYKERKQELKSKKMFSAAIARYLAKAYTAYADPSVSEEQKEIEKEELLDIWARIKKIERFIMIFEMEVANNDGSPTKKGIDLGMAAKAHLKKASREVSEKLLEEQEASRRKKALREAEQEEIENILSMGRLALTTGEDEE